VDGLTVTVDITNTGEVAGKEIVQVYVRDRVSGLVRPQKELKGFVKVALQPGETRPVAIKLDFRAFAYYHPKHEQWITEDGGFDILIASSAADVRQTLAVMLESTLDLPYLLDRESTVREWLADPRGKAVFRPVYAMMEEQMRNLLDAGEGDEHPIGINVMEMMADMPLVNVLGWQESVLPMSAEDLVDGLLEQAHGQTT
jgi:beta-glucosidase